MKKTALLLIAVLMLFGTAVNGQKLSAEAEISVITLGPSQYALYSAFGHSAFRVRDPQRDMDLIYNYGVFDFDQPNFYLNFAKGDPYYMLGVHEFENFEYGAIRENRKMIEQVLNLNQAEKQQLFDFLIWNAQPANRNYYYNYIYDNCATKIRDVTDSLFADRVQFDFSYKQDYLSFRDLMDLYLSEQPWGDLGIDICLGTGIDKIAPAEDYMFLPDYVEAAFAGGSLKTDSATVPLVKETHILHVGGPQQLKASLITPKMLFTAIFLFFGFITFKDIKRGKRSSWVDLLLFGATGMVGWLLVYLWFFTNHISAYNYNLLWAVPFNFPIILFLSKKKTMPWVKYYFLAFGILQTLLILTWAVLPQRIHFSLLPLVLLMLFRAFTIFYFLKKDRT